MQCSCKRNFTDGMLVLQEARAKDMISQLKLEMNNLTRLVEAGAGLSIGEESTMNELLKQKEDLTKERDAQVQPHLMTAQLWAVAFNISACWQVGRTNPAFCLTFACCTDTGKSASIMQQPLQCHDDASMICTTNMPNGYDHDAHTCSNSPITCHQTSACGSGQHQHSLCTLPKAFEYSLIQLQQRYV